MYIPKSFAQEDLPTLQQFMQANSFATLVTIEDGIPIATHLPFMLDTQTGANGTLIAHMARANSQWKAMFKDETVLVIFQGPHAYVSSSWYEEPNTIPTWNYTAVHAYGKPHVIHDVDELDAMVARLVNHHDPTLIDRYHHYPESKLKSIVGLTIEIERLEGKYKMSQNREVVDQEHVVDHLKQSRDSVEQSLAQMMRENIDRNQTL